MAIPQIKGIAHDYCFHESIDFLLTRFQSLFRHENLKTGFIMFEGKFFKNKFGQNNYKINN